MLPEYKIERLKEIYTSLVIYGTNSYMPMGKEIVPKRSIYAISVVSTSCFGNWK